MSQARPRSNFFLILLWAVTLYLGFSLFFNKGPEDKRTSAQIFSAMQTLNKEIKDFSIAREQNKLNDRLQLEVKAGNVTEQAAEELKFKAGVLIADTQYKASKQRAEINRITLAQATLTNLKNQYNKAPFFTSAVKVAEHKDFPRTEVTLDSLKDEVKKEGMRLGKETKVWGFFPGYELIDMLVRITGSNPAFSYAFACLLLAVMVRGIVWPLAQKQYMWGRQMSQLTPLVTEIKEEYKNKPQKQQEMNMKVMALYQEYGLNPMAGCGPALLQMPLFLLIYQAMLHYKYEFQNGQFLWVNEALGKNTNGFLAPNLGERDYILIVLYGISMVVTTLMTPVSDPTNARQQRLMGIGIAVIFTLFMFTGAFPVPAAFVLYWIFTNVLATLQALRAYRLPLPEMRKVNSPNGGLFPVTSPNGSAKSSSGGKTGVPQRFKPKKKR